MSSTAALSRMRGGVLISLIIVVGLFAMHGLVGSSGVSACHGDPGFVVADSPAVSASSADPAGSVHHPTRSTGAVVEPASAMEFAGSTCVSTLPRLVAVSNPLLIGFVALVVLCGGIGYRSLQRYYRWDQWLAPPSSGVAVLRLKCVLRT
ncbi:hypothetical protein GS502_01040 [Rhodococcus hoagii]|nr:hypothetical protein [Prescottella equi]